MPRPALRRRPRGTDGPAGALRPLVLGQAALGGCIAVCVAVTPRFVLEANEGGVSNYGVAAATVLPYSLALGGAAAGLWRAASRLAGGVAPRRLLVTGLRAVAAGFAAVLVSTYPYKLDGTLERVHVLTAVGLFLAEGVVVAGVVVGPDAPGATRVWAGVWAVGFVTAGLTLAGTLHLLLVAQAVMAVGFAGVTISVVARGARPARASPADPLRSAG